jgi:ubiquinol-cytochrome c reductase iron-sulfur subunit
MAALSSTSRTLLRALPRRSLPSLPVRALSTTASKSQPTDTAGSSFDSPFKGMGNSQTTKIPDFSHYRSNKSSNSNLVFQYFMVGSMGALTAVGAKATVQGTCRGIPVRAGAVRARLL